MAEEVNAGGGIVVAHACVGGTGLNGGGLVVDVGCGIGSGVVTGVENVEVGCGVEVICDVGGSGFV